MKHTKDSNRKGDFAEYYAVTWLWDNGYEVFQNSGCTGPIDIIAMDKDGNISGFECMNATVTKWLRSCLSDGISDKDLLKWSIEERTDAFLKLQNHLSLGEGKASK